MIELLHGQYMKEIQSLANNMVSEEMENCHGDREAAKESINNTELRTAIDRHRWIIYNAYNYGVIRHSDNTDYYTDKFGKADGAHIFEKRGLDGLLNAIAFWCMYGDVQDKLSGAFDAYEKAHEEKAQACYQCSV